MPESDMKGLEHVMLLFIPRDYNLSSFTNPKVMRHNIAGISHMIDDDTRVSIKRSLEEEYGRHVNVVGLDISFCGVTGVTAFVRYCPTRFKDPSEFERLVQFTGHTMTGESHSIPFPVSYL